MHALISIHDVMPETLENVSGIIERLPDACRPHLVLLVVPGRNWQPFQIEQLREWQQQGYILAGHGWHHEVKEIRSLYHRLHAALISRRAAEHLSQPADQLRSLLSRNYAWFIGHKLQAPDFYVPPAWAMGALNLDDLALSPFRYFETLQGIMDSASGKRLFLPLAGFESDNRFRCAFLQPWNSLQRILSSSRRPLRIGIHPHDFEYGLSGQLERFLRQTTHSLHYSELFTDWGTGAV